MFEQPKESFATNQVFMALITCNEVNRWHKHINLSALHAPFYCQVLRSRHIRKPLWVQITPVRLWRKETEPLSRSSPESCGSANPLIKSRLSLWPFIWRLGTIHWLVHNPLKVTATNYTLPKQTDAYPKLDCAVLHQKNIQGLHDHPMDDLCVCSSFIAIVTVPQIVVQIWCGQVIHFTT